MNTPAALTADNLRTRFGWRADRRPEPGFGHVLGAGAGAFLVFATVALVVEIAGDDNATLPGVLFSLALMVVAVALGIQTAGPLRAAAVTILVLTTPVLWFFVFLGNGEGGRGDARAIYLLSIAVYAVLFLVLWTRGRGVLLAALLIAFTAWVLFEVGGDTGGNVPFQDQVSSNTDFSIQSSGNGDFEQGEQAFEEEGDTTTETSATALALGLIYLIGAWGLDRQSTRGLATPLIAVGAISAGIGAIALGAEDSALAGGLSAAGIGAVVGIIGGLGLHRRGTTWIGVIGIVIGLAVVAADTTDDPLGLAGLFALFAIALGVIGVLVAPRFGEFVDGDEQAGTVTGPRG